VLKLELRVGESVKIGESVITLDDKSGKTARLSIQADKSVPIRRIQPSSMAQIAKSGIGAYPVPA
jgi:sRNA-binding carbon storage regulator CsrA